jgi:asparagine synthase (glutamine-hydrolysing)
MVTSLRHRGPDDEGWHVEPDGMAGLGHNRLSILDLSPAGHQPMWDARGERVIVFNGEIYNYLELRRELTDYPFITRTDTEVILAAYDRWGEACLDRLIGMFAFLIWDRREGRLFAARDRFGVKPLHYHQSPDGSLAVASEIKALHAAGVLAQPDAASWASYLTRGLYDHSERTFWGEVYSLPPGHMLIWRQGRVEISCWYDLAKRTGLDFDTRPVNEVEEDYIALLEESVRFRFRSDVPVGVNLSGGLDSSLLLALMQRIQGKDSETMAFTFVTGDPEYDELPWVEQMIRQTRHPLHVCRLNPEDVPDLAASVAAHEDEPFGGLPTLAYARLFERARSKGVIVLLDGQGLDEQWAGYDYYATALEGRTVPTIQGTSSRPVRPECLRPEFAALADSWRAPQPFQDELRNAQYRDARFTKIPRALRFNDRISMRSSTELREPFLDHRLFELALRQPPGRKIDQGTSKVLLRRIAKRLLPSGIAEAPKRALQTPQREWLKGPLRDWAQNQIETALECYGASWLHPEQVRTAWKAYLERGDDNSFYIWQWISLGQLANVSASPTLN